MSAFQVKSESGNFVRLDNLIDFNEVAEAKELNRYNKMRSITLERRIRKRIFTWRSN